MVTSTIDRPETMDAIDLESHHDPIDAWTRFRHDPRPAWRS
jgi:hypothetical protein